MGNCCCKKTRLIFALGTNDAFLNALQSIEEKKYNLKPDIFISINI